MNYNGKKLIPIGNILGGYNYRARIVNFSEKLELEDYSYDKFYKIAKENNCAVDVFMYGGKYYMPTNNGLYLLEDFDLKHLKRMNEYKKQYKNKIGDEI